MTLYLLKVHLQTFLSIPVPEKCQILNCDTLVANEQYEDRNLTKKKNPCLTKRFRIRHFLFLLIIMW